MLNRLITVLLKGIRNQNNKKQTREQAPERTPSARDYEALLPQVLQKLFPDEKERERAVNIISRYQRRELHRVHLGILKVSNGDFELMEKYTQWAIWDWRDLLTPAEYPLSSKQWKLKEEDPQQYAELQKREYDDYDDWVKSVLES